MDMMLEEPRLALAEVLIFFEKLFQAIRCPPTLSSSFSKTGNLFEIVT
jgi:hypothetical protein